MRRVYSKFKKALITGGASLNLQTGNLKVLLIDTDAYTYNDAHEFLIDVPSGARVAGSRDADRGHWCRSDHPSGRVAGATAWPARRHWPC
jgi:hypothetical protein